MKKLLATMLALVMALTLCATAWADSVFTNGVATVSNELELKAALAEAKTATEPVTIDLNGATYAVNGFARDADAYIHIEANVTLKNGTFDVTGANCGDGFSGIISIREDAAVTFENVYFTGNVYKSAAGVIAITDIHGVDYFCTLTLKECSFNLKNEQAAGAASIIYGTGINNCKVVIDNCTFTLENTNRIFLQMTIDMKESSLTDTTTNESAEHAFRNVAGEIKNSTVSITGTHKTGIKNSAGAELKITDSNVALSGARTSDLVLENSASVVLDADSSLAYDKMTSDVAVLVLDPDGGAMEKPFLFANGGEIKADLGEVTPVKSGYKFLGWYNGETKVDGTVTVDAGTTTNLTAKWDVKTSNVTINGSDTSSETGSATITAGEKFTLTETPATSSTTPAASAEFNGSAATAIVDNIPVGTEKVELTVTAKAAAATVVEENNQAAYEAATTNTSTTNAVVVSIDLKAGNTKLFTKDDVASAMGEVYAIVKVPYKTGMKNITVQHLDGNTAVGLVEVTDLSQLENTAFGDNYGYFNYDSTTGVITMKLPHFSQYLINAEKASSGGHARPILSGGATAADTVKDKAESPKTFDAGIAVYGVMAISSVLGMGYMGKKKF